MDKSESINELATALCKAQGEMKPAVKDAVNPFFHSRYSTLDALKESLREPFLKHGLSVTQTTEETERGTILITTLMHGSGQYISGKYPVRPVKADPQSLGAAISYSRRYSLAAISGQTSDEDDDGNAASGKSQPPAKQDPVTSAAESLKKAIGDTAPPGGRFASPTDAQIKRLHAMATANHWPKDYVKTYADMKYGVKSSKELTREQYDDFCKWIEGHPMPEVKK